MYRYAGKRAGVQEARLCGEEGWKKGENWGGQVLKSDMGVEDGGGLSHEWQSQMCSCSLQCRPLPTSHTKAVPFEKDVKAPLKDSM